MNSQFQGRSGQIHQVATLWIRDLKRWDETTKPENTRDQVHPSEGLCQETVQKLRYEKVRKTPSHQERINMSGYVSGIFFIMLTHY